MKFEQIQPEVTPNGDDDIHTLKFIIEFNQFEICGLNMWQRHLERVLCKSTKISDKLALLHMYAEIIEGRAQ